MDRNSHNVYKHVMLPQGYHFHTHVRSYGVVSCN